MPELPDITVYIEHLEKRLRGQELARMRLIHPFVLRSVSPPIASAEGKKVLGLRRIGKRIVIELEGKLSATTGRTRAVFRTTSADAGVIHSLATTAGRR